MRRRRITYTIGPRDGFSFWWVSSRRKWLRTEDLPLENVGGLLRARVRIQFPAEARTFARAKRIAARCPAANVEIVRWFGNRCICSWTVTNKEKP